MRAAVDEIDEEADEHPAAGDELRAAVERGDHRSADKHSEDRYYRYKRRAEGAMQIGLNAPHHPHSDANEHKREQRADGREIARQALRYESGEDAYEEEQHDVAFVRRAELGMHI